MNSSSSFSRRPLRFQFGLSLLLLGKAQEVPVPTGAAKVTAFRTGVARQSQIVAVSHRRELYLKGFTNKEVADKLSLSVHTIDATIFYPAEPSQDRAKARHTTREIGDDVACNQARDGQQRGQHERAEGKRSVD